MWLNSLVSGMQNTASNYGIGNGKNEDPAAALKLNRYIAGMKAGQTIQGEIVSKTGSEVAIKLADDMVLNARLENDMELELGKLLTLEVRSNMGGTLSLSPLFENMGLDANVLKALDMAGLPTNDRTIEMADSMMKNGMSVSRESLQEVFKKVITYKDVPPSDIVSLHKLGVEVTRENLEQFNNYKNLNHQVIRGVTDVVNELPEAFNTLMQSGEPTKAVALFDAVINTVILEQEAEPETVMSQNEPAAITAQENEPVAVMPQVNENPEVPVQVAAQGESEAPAVLNETKAETEAQAIPQGKEEAAQTTVSAAPNENQPVNIQNRIIEMYTAAKTPEAKAELFADKEFQNLVKEAIVNKWTLTPEAVTDKSNVEALYQRLRTGLSHLELEARETAGTNAPITQAATNLNNNIDFMNQLNHMYTYIQLPLKMQNGEQHGELFVYTNKHSLASKDGSVSAFLHLDMDNLGPVDCFVAMKDSKVNTNFRLKDDETLKFIEDHMDILNSRLEKRGYSLNVKCNLMDEETSGMEEILKTDNLKVFGGHHSFDVRT
ncbi:hook-length control protein FliK [Lachnospiraceae bacterium G11]|nr:hook-length control protein FliK [Lachnospiraceae bacterium G11]